MTTASKAFAGALSGLLVHISGELLPMAPGWMHLSPALQADLVQLAALVIGFAVVYYSPPNQAVPLTDRVVPEVPHG